MGLLHPLWDRFPRGDTMLSNVPFLFRFLSFSKFQMHKVSATWMDFCKHAGPHASCIQSTHVRVHMNARNRKLVMGNLGEDAHSADADDIGPLVRTRW